MNQHTHLIFSSSAITVNQLSVKLEGINGKDICITSLIKHEKSFIFIMYPIFLSGSYEESGDMTREAQNNVISHIYMGESWKVLETRENYL